MGKTQKEIKIGDLVKLKKTFNIKPPHTYEKPDELGIGIVIDKLTELFILVADTNTNEVKPNKKFKNTLNSIQTKIWKVYWIKVEKIRWEYENDLQALEVEASNN